MKVTQPSTPPAAATRSAISAPKGPAMSSGRTSEAACRVIRSAHAARSSAKTGQEIRCCGGRLSRWVRIATVPWAWAQRRPNSKRALTSSADQCAPRSRSTTSSAAANVAVRVLGARPDVALVEMGVDVDQPRPDLPALLAEGGPSSDGSPGAAHLGSRRLDSGDPPRRRSRCRPARAPRPHPRSRPPADRAAPGRR